MNVEAMLEQVEGKPAPMPLLAVQAFANTLDVEDAADRLESPAKFARWLEESGLAKKGIQVTKSGLDAARELRNAVRGLLAANQNAAPPDAGRKAAATIGELARSFPISLTADSEGNLQPDLTPVDRAVQLLPQLLAVVFWAQATGTFDRLKLCENPECAWAFYDSTRNRSGSWCRMGQCGNRLKNRAYRKRQHSR